MVRSHMGSAMAKLSTHPTNTGLLVTLCFGLLVGSISLAQVRPVDPEAAEMEGFAEVEDLHIVDCLLPGEVRRMGRMVHMSPRIPYRTTALDCRIRGGEYVAYSRADYRSALKVWLDRARTGDAQAQHYVGEIHEKGLGVEPDFVEAARWYHKAAEQGHSRSMVNLAYLYEQGLGVPADPAQALHWYRKSAGLTEDELIFASVAREQIAALEAELGAELEQARQEREVLAQQVARLESELAVTETAGEDAARRLAAEQQTIATLQRLLDDASARAEATEDRLVRLRGTAVEMPVATTPTPAPPVALDGRDFGNYYALIVGLQSYQFWEPLDSPHNDARALAQLLAERYGFETSVLLDASAREIMSAINDLHQRVGPADNVLIYFAGHGQLLRADDTERRRGFWLPVNAEPERTTFWLSNSAINDHLALLEARSVLVVADSCYGGAMSTDPASILVGHSGPVNERLIELGLARQARFVLSSGGLSPVLDHDGGDHSIFARALIEVLKSNDGILREQDLYRQVVGIATTRIEPLGLEQTPELRPIRQAGHAAGNFFFVPRT